MMVGRGGRVESQTDFQAIITWGTPVNHLVHLILTLLSGFLWAPVWLALAIFGGEKREVVRVNEWGNVLVTRVQNSE